MVMHLVNKSFILLMIIGGAACTTNLTQDTDDTKSLAEFPRWTVRLPGKVGIYNDGLIGLPIISGNVIFHSTIFTSPIEEDNRLYALNLETGNIKWVYPETYCPQEPCFFNGRPHVYNSTLVIKMQAFSPFANHDRILILDGNKGKLKKIIHLPTEFSRSTTRDVAGIGGEAWFIQEDQSATLVYYLNMHTGDTTLLTRICSSHPQGRMEMSLREFSTYTYNGQQLLLLGLSDYLPNQTNACIALLNTTTGTFFYTTQVLTDDNFPVNDAVLTGSRIVYTSGRIAASIDIIEDSLCWQVSTGNVADSIMPGLLVQNNTVFLWGHKACKALDLESGTALYRHSVECVNVNGFPPWIVIVDNNGKVSVVGDKTGEIKRILQLSSSKDERYGFSYGCKPGFDGRGGVFLFGKFHAYYFSELLN